MPVAVIATIEAYAIKAALGGGFRGLYAAVGGEAVKSDVLPTIEAARYWAQKKAYDLHHATPGYKVAAMYGKGSVYRANIWVNA